MFRSLLAERFATRSGGPPFSFGGLLSLLIIVDHGVHPGEPPRHRVSTRRLQHGFVLSLCWTLNHTGFARLSPGIYEFDSTVAGSAGVRHSFRLVRRLAQNC